MPGRYRIVKALIPPDKADLVEEFLHRNGANLGTYLEALAELVAELGPDASPEAYVGKFDEVLSRAQALTLERRRRR